MYSRFTHGARKVIQRANQEAQRFQHEYIGSEHILLGLATDGGVAVNVLWQRLGLEPSAITSAVEKLVEHRRRTGEQGIAPEMPRAKKVIEYAMEESRNLACDYVGAEHILLALLHDDVGLAAAALADLGLRLEETRAEVRRFCGPSKMRISIGGDSARCRATSRHTVGSARLTTRQKVIFGN